VHPERAVGILLVTVSFLTAASACTSESKDKVASDPVPAEQVAASRQARVKYKSGARYANDLAAALDLPREAVCRELGRYDCVDEVHRIVLGGVEPYTLGVREPLPSIAVTAPIAQDRVALAACTARIERDLAASEPVFLTTVDVDAPTPGSSRRRPGAFTTASSVARRRPTRSAPWRSFIRP
jgi:hypothetical protein